MNHSHALAKINSQESTIKNLRERAKEAAERTTATLAVLGGGCIGGFIDGKWGQDKKIFGVDPGLAVGGALTVAGLMGWGGRSSEYLGSVGEGILAYELGNRVRVSTQAQASGVGYDAVRAFRPTGT